MTYTGYSVPMADLTVADGFPFPLSGSVRDAIIPLHFASDPHVDSRWWFRLVAASSESTRAASGPVDDSADVAVVVGGDRDGTTEVRSDRTTPAFSPARGTESSTTVAASGTTGGGGAGVAGRPEAGGGEANADGQPASRPPPPPPPINIPRISGLLNNPAGLYDYLVELAREMGATGGGGAGSTTPMPPPDTPALAVSTDRASYARGQAILVSGTTTTPPAGGGQRADPFVLISITGPDGASVASLLAPIVTSAGQGPLPYSTSIDTSEWTRARAPAGNMTVIAVRGADTATASFKLHDDGNASATPRPPSTIIADEHCTRPAAGLPPLPAQPTIATVPHSPLTIAAGDVEHRHGDTVLLSGTATRPIADPLVLISASGPDGAALASLTTSVGPDGMYSRNITTHDWPSMRPAGYGTVTAVAIRGPDTAAATFELLPPQAPLALISPPDIPGIDIAGGGTWNATVPGGLPTGSTSPTPTSARPACAATYGT